MNVERIRDQLLEWTITGRTPDQAATLLREAASAIEWLDAAGIHTCSDVCTRWACVMRRENESLKAELAAERAESAWAWARLTAQDKKRDETSVIVKRYRQNGTRARD